MPSRVLDVDKNVAASSGGGVDGEGSWFSNLKSAGEEIFSLE